MYIKNTSFRRSLLKSTKDKGTHLHLLDQKGDWHNGQVDL